MPIEIPLVSKKKKKKKKEKKIQGTRTRPTSEERRNEMWQRRNENCRGREENSLTDVVYSSTNPQGWQWLLFRFFSREIILSTGIANNPSDCQGPDQARFEFEGREESLFARLSRPVSRTHERLARVERRGGESTWKRRISSEFAGGRKFDESAVKREGEQTEVR